MSSPTKIMGKPLDKSQQDPSSGTIARYFSILIVLLTLIYLGVYRINILERQLFTSENERNVYRTLFGTPELQRGTAQSFLAGGRGTWDQLPDYLHSPVKEHLFREFKAHVSQELEELVENPVRGTQRLHDLTTYVKRNGRLASYANGLNDDDSVASGSSIDWATGLKQARLLEDYQKVQIEVHRANIERLIREPLSPDNEDESILYLAGDTDEFRDTWGISNPITPALKEALATKYPFR